MEQYNFKYFIFLSLINNIPEFRDSYSISRVLAWKFDIIDISAIAKSLELLGMIVKLKNAAVSEYNITTSGKLYLAAYNDKGQLEAYNKNKEEYDFINTLFRAK